MKVVLILINDETVPGGVVNVRTLQGLNVDQLDELVDALDQVARRTEHSIKSILMAEE